MFKSRVFIGATVLGLLLVAVGALVFSVHISEARSATGVPAGRSGVATYRGLLPVAHFDVSPPLRSIAGHPSGPSAQREIHEPSIPGITTAATGRGVAGVVQKLVGALAIPTPSVSFDGPPNLCNCSPPDPNGVIGSPAVLSDVVVMTNLDFQVFTRAGTSVYGPVANNTLWAGFGGACQTENSGDPVVLYDQLADRWLLSQFTAAGPTYYNCVALSTTNDPTGSYYRYAFTTGTNFPDYPKYGKWPNAYFISTREFAGSSFAGVGAYAANRAQMLAGNPSPQVISFLAAPSPAYIVGDGLLPADLDGTTPPPSNNPEYYMGSEDNNGPYGAPADALSLWKFTVDFANPPASSFVLANTVPTAAFNSIFAPCGGTRNCIPQPGTTNKIDHLGYRQRPLFRLAYRNMGSYETLITNQSVDAGAGPGGEIAGIHWWELRSPNSSPTIFQEGTYAPGLTDGIHRWMGSMAMNSVGDIALGYSASSATVFPSIYYTGRLVTDPAGTFPQGEAAIVNGTGSQTGSPRWGDYTDMTVDPADDCTFWYVNEYVPTTSAVGWRARVGSFRIRTCTQATPTPTVTGTPPTATRTATGTNTPATTNTPTATNTPAAPTATPTCGGPTAWQAGPAFNPGVYAVQGALGSDNKFYVPGGLNAMSTPIPSQMARYDPVANNWSTVAPPPVTTGENSVGAANGKIFDAAGFIGGTAITSTLQIYDIAGNTWSFGASLPASVEAAAGIVLNGKFYVVGGDDFTNSVRSTYIYDIASNTWTTGPQIPDTNGRTNTYGVAANGLVYVWGGVYLQGTTNVPIDTLIIYNPGTNSWTTSSSANTGGLGNYGAVATYGAGKLLVTDGGDGLFNPSTSTHIYDIASNTWASGPAMITAREGHAQGTLADGRIIVASGLNSATTTTTASELLAPPVSCTTATATATIVPSTATRTATVVPPTATSILPTVTIVLPTLTTFPATRTNTPLPATATSVLPTATPTSLAATSTTGPATATTTPCTINFSDVHPSDYFYTPVLYLYCHNVVSGYADGTFRPYANTTRSQMVKIVVLGFNKPISTPAGGAYTFTDVPPANPFFGYVETAAALNIVSGYTCGQVPAGPCDAQHRPYFLPYAPVTRGQLSKIDVVAAGWALLNPASRTFEDVLPGTAFYTFVETAACHGVVSGYTCGGPGEPCGTPPRPYFRQYNNATRGQIAKIVYLSITNGTGNCPVPTVSP